jgi:hypothetical protein
VERVADQVKVHSGSFLKGHPLFPELPVGPPFRVPQPWDRVQCPHCQGWGVFNFENDGVPLCSPEFWLCGGEKHMTRAEAEAYTPETEGALSPSPERENDSCDPGSAWDGGERHERFAQQG